MLLLGVGVIYIPQYFYIIKQMLKKRLALKLKEADSLKREKITFTIHHKKRKTASLKTKLQGLKSDQKNNVIRICFGTRKLFNAQFHLEENAYETHEDWRGDWDYARNNQFTFIGSKDENTGNQSCVVTVNEDGSLNLKLRLPHALAEKYGKHIVIYNVRFAYQHDVVLAALKENADRVVAKETGDVTWKLRGQAITYKFIVDKKGWSVHLTTNMQAPKMISNKYLGGIGVDINSDHLAVVETDHFGNPIKHRSIPIVTYGKTNAQREAVIGDACAEVVKQAVETQKPIAIEKLDFRDKKAALKESCGPKRARMLSSFAYNMIIQFMLSRAFRFGIEVMHVNPAYTSVIGWVKYAKRYGLTKHQAAALVIIRRAFGFCEPPPSLLGSVPTGKGSDVTFPVPVRNRAKHVSSFWKEISRNATGALVAHFREQRDLQSRGPPKSTPVTGQGPPEVVGAIPTPSPQNCSVDDVPF